MTTNNAVNTSLSGQTGTGTFVGSTSPTLVTPTLGAAVATSINFGGSSLANYVSEGSWTPVFTFATPGNLSVSYATQFGNYTRIGSVVYYIFLLSCTPTFTTASGGAQITGLPVTCFGVNCVGGPLQTSTNMTYPAGTTAPFVSVTAGSTLLNISAAGSNTASVALSATNFTSGSAISISATGFYFV